MIVHILFPNWKALAVRNHLHLHDLSLFGCSHVRGALPLLTHHHRISSLLLMAYHLYDSISTEEHRCNHHIGASWLRYETERERDHKPAPPPWSSPTTTELCPCEPKPTRRVTYSTRDTFAQQRFLHVLSWGEEMDTSDPWLRSGFARGF